MEKTQAQNHLMEVQKLCSTQQPLQAALTAIQERTGLSDLQRGHSLSNPPENQRTGSSSAGLEVRKHIRISIAPVHPEGQLEQ